MDKWVPTTCMFLSAVLGSAAYFLWTTQMSNASDIITTNLQEEIIQEELEQKTQQNKIEDPFKILIVPGHDEEDYGAKYKDLTEEEINLDLSMILFDHLKKDQSFEVFITRETGKYNEEFKEYFEKEKEGIVSFIESRKDQTADLIDSGAFEPTRVVEHNVVSGDVSLRLYGINKWVNENDIDLVLHVHFNDYPRKKNEFKYTGFSIYVPSAGMTGYEGSKKLGETLRENLSKHFKESNLPVESDIVIENSDLIAVGSNNTLEKSNSVLIEYGYIYEDIFYNEEKRGENLEKAAFETYLSIKDLF